MSIRCILYAGLVPLVLPLTSAVADDVRGANKLLCSSLEAIVCREEGNCVAVFPEDVNIPQFLAVDVKNGKLSTTAASNEKRETVVESLKRVDGKLIFQGYELGRAFSLLIEEATGKASLASAAEDRSAIVFAACTPV